MTLVPFTIDARPGATSLTIAGTPVEGAISAVLQLSAAADVVPTLIVQHAGEGQVAGEGIVHVIREPTAAEIDDAAIAALARIDPAALQAKCEEKVRAGRRDPYRVALEVIVEMARG